MPTDKKSPSISIFYTLRLGDRIRGRIISSGYGFRDYIDKRNSLVERAPVATHYYETILDNRNRLILGLRVNQQRLNKASAHQISFSATKMGETNLGKAERSALRKILGK